MCWFILLKQVRVSYIRLNAKVRVRMRARVWPGMSTPSTAALKWCA